MSRLTSAFTFMLALLIAYEGQTMPDAATESNQSTILITTIAGFASLIATHIFSMWREHRNRRWDLQDREAARREMRQHAETQRIETIQTAVDLAKASHIASQRVLDRIDANTTITQAAKETAEAAYVAANSFNAHLDTLRSQLTQRADIINHIDEVGTDTNKKVDDIKDDLKKAP